VYGARTEELTRALLGRTTAPWAIGGLCAAILAADVVLPIPSSLVMAWCGAKLGFLGGAAAVWAGLTAGACLGYLIGLTGGWAALARLAGGADAAVVADVVRRHAGWALAVFRAVPVLAEISVVMTGVARPGWRLFVIVVAPANLGVAVVYAGLGALAAETATFLLATSAAIVLPWVVWLALRRPRPVRRV
jgi:uncharacterized membrane protein YdjX (TVP38/TMEM64 family)